MVSDDIYFASITEINQKLKAKQFSAVELTKAFCDRLETLGPRYNALALSLREQAVRAAKDVDGDIKRERLRGPLQGVPFGAKDLLSLAKHPTTWGAKPYEKQVFDYNATVVERLETAGAVLVAKLSMGELAMGDVWFGGTTRNPWRPSSGSSGSSAGPGSAIAAGLVGFAIGTETLGSIVSPSVVNGVTGLRPTYGRVSRHGAMALCWTMDKLGPMCRGVEDCAMVLSAIHGPDGHDPTVPSIPFRWDPTADLEGIRAGIDSVSSSSAVTGAGEPGGMPGT